MKPPARAPERDYSHRSVVDKLGVKPGAAVQFDETAGPLDADLTDWDETLAVLRALHIADTVSVARSYDDRFIKNYYARLVARGGH